MKKLGPYSSPMPRGTYGDPEGVGVSYERGAPVQTVGHAGTNLGQDRRWAASVASVWVSRL